MARCWPERVTSFSSQCFIATSTYLSGDTRQSRHMQASRGQNRHIQDSHGQIQDSQGTCKKSSKKPGGPAPSASSPPRRTCQVIQDSQVQIQDSQDTYKAVTAYTRQSRPGTRQSRLDTRQSRHIKQSQVRSQVGQLPVLHRHFDVPVGGS
jgi:hypothetical protein